MNHISIEFHMLLKSIHYVSPPPLWLSCLCLAAFMLMHRNLVPRSEWAYSSVQAQCGRRHTSFPGYGSAGAEGVSAWKPCARRILKILATFSEFTEAVSSAELHEFWSNGSC